MPRFGQDPDLDPESDPGPWSSEPDPRIRIRIKMKRIRNTETKNEMHFCLDNCDSEELLEQKNDEKMALESIYGSAFRNRLAPIADYAFF